MFLWHPFSRDLPKMLHGENASPNSHRRGSREDTRRKDSRARASPSSTAGPRWELGPNRAEDLILSSAVRHLSSPIRVHPSPRRPRALLILLVLLVLLSPIPFRVVQKAVAAGDCAPGVHDEKGDQFGQRHGETSVGRNGRAVRAAGPIRHAARDGMASARMETATQVPESTS